MPDRPNTEAKECLEKSLKSEKKSKKQHVRREKQPLIRKAMEREAKRAARRRDHLERVAARKKNAAKKGPTDKAPRQPCRKKRRR